MTGILKKINPLRLFLKISQVGYILLIFKFQFLKTGIDHQYTICNNVCWGLLL